MDKCQLNAILSLMPGHVYWKNTDGVLQGCNLALAKFLGFNSPKEIVGKTDFDLGSKKEAETIRKFDFSVMNEKTEKVTEEVYQLPDGTKAIYLSRKSPLYNDSGEIVGIVGISFDITAEKHLEKLEIQNVLEKKRSAYLKAAAGTIAHDLRTPLASLRAIITGVLIPFQKLVEGYQLAKEHNLIEEMIRPAKLKALEAGLNRCFDVLDFSNSYIDLILNNLKYDSIQTKDFTTFNLTEATEEAINTYPYVDDEYSLIHLSYDKTYTVHGHKLYFKNILNNLLKNSFYFIKSVGRGNIYIWFEENPLEIILCFKDTAKGAPQSVLDKMFESYFSDREGGTGLGLAFCYSIMESFGGSIKADSVEGQYMQLNLQFPKLK